MSLPYMEVSAWPGNKVINGGEPGTGCIKKKQQSDKIKTIPVCKCSKCLRFYHSDGKLESMLQILKIKACFLFYFLIGVNKHDVSDTLSVAMQVNHNFEVQIDLLCVVLNSCSCINRVFCFIK